MIRSVHLQDHSWLVVYPRVRDNRGNDLGFVTEKFVKVLKQVAKNMGFNIGWELM